MGESNEHFVVKMFHSHHHHHIWSHVAPIPDITLSVGETLDSIATSTFVS